MSLLEIGLFFFIALDLILEMLARECIIPPSYPFEAEAVCTPSTPASFALSISPG